MFKIKGTKQHFIVLKRGVAYLGLCFGKITLALVYLDNRLEAEIDKTPHPKTHASQVHTEYSLG